jgi:hypothetical protein
MVYPAAVTTVAEESGSGPPSRVPLLAAFRAGLPETGWGLVGTIYGAFVVIGVWIALLPIAPAVVEIVMRRYHLSTSRFMFWAAQQVVPSMYSFGNEYAARREDVPVDELFAQQIPPTQWVNHFPLRLFTWGPRGDVPEAPFFLYVRSRYRGVALRTKVRVDRAASGGFRLSWVEDRFGPSTPTR